MYTGDRYGVSHQCELLNVSVNEMIGKTTLYTGDRYGVSPQCELSNVIANEMIGKKRLSTLEAGKGFFTSMYS